jgi:hypothetical protein
MQKYCPDLRDILPDRIEGEGNMSLRPGNILAYLLSGQEHINIIIILSV